MITAEPRNVPALEPGAPRTHDLLRLNPAGWATVEDASPPWVSSARRDAACVVVRRAAAPPGAVAVGVRGDSRRQRFGTLISCGDIAGIITPESLARSGLGKNHARGDSVPAFRALAGASTLLAAAGFSWGPVGSVGFELATGRVTATPASDLDLIIYAGEKLPPADARELTALLATLACRIDVLLETPLGGVALAEWAKSPARVLVRTGRGPVLLGDPWEARSVIASR